MNYQAANPDFPHQTTVTSSTTRRNGRATAGSATSSRSESLPKRTRSCSIVRRHGVRAGDRAEVGTATGRSRTSAKTDERELFVECSHFKKETTWDQWRRGRWPQTAGAGPRRCDGVGGPIVAP